MVYVRFASLTRFFIQPRVATKGPGPPPEPQELEETLSRIFS